MKLWAIMVTQEVAHCWKKMESSTLLESSQMVAWVNMALSTNTPELVVIIGSGSKIISTQIQGSQLTAVAQAEVEMKIKMSLMNVLIQMLPLMELSYLTRMVMSALNTTSTLHGVENIMTMISILWKCAAVVVVVIELAAKMKKYKMILLSVLIQMLPLMGLSYLTDMGMVVLSTIVNQAGVEVTTTMISCLEICAAFVAVVALVGKTMETRVKIKEEKKMIPLSVLTQMFVLMEVLSMMIMVLAALNILSNLTIVEDTTQMNLSHRKCAAFVAVVDNHITATVHVLVMTSNAGGNVLNALMFTLEMEKRKENKKVERKKKSKMVGK